MYKNCLQMDRQMDGQCHAIILPFIKKGLIKIIDIPKYQLIFKNLVWTHFLFSLHFNASYLKLLAYQSKFSGTRKIILRYH